MLFFLFCLHHAKNYDLGLAWDGGRWWDWCDASPNWRWERPLTSNCSAQRCGSRGKESLCKVQRSCFALSMELNINVIRNESNEELERLSWGIGYHWYLRLLMHVYWPWVLQHAVSVCEDTLFIRAKLFRVLSSLMC